MARKETQVKPRFTQTSAPLQILVEGVGDVVDLFYSPALEQLKGDLKGKREVIVTFVDRSDLWRNNPLEVKRQRTIATISAWGAEYLDKSDPSDFKLYSRLPADVVFVATPDRTHVVITEHWLKRPRPPEQIFVEKPLDASLMAARRLLGVVAAYDNRVLAFDHYRARLLPTRTQMHHVLGFLGKGVRSFTFYFLEDRSGGDPKYRPRTQRNGPIENEQRVDALRGGMILDGMPHMPALLAHFGRVETIRVTHVRAGQYVGLDDDPGRRTEIDKETFAQVKFTFSDHVGNRVEGAAYVGKGIRGVRSLGGHYDHNAKILDVEGVKQGTLVRFDLRSSGSGASRAYLIENGNNVLEFALNPKPYATLVERVARGTYIEDGLALHVEVGKRILEVLEDMRHAIPDGKNIPTYPCGMAGVRESLYLEDLVNSGPNELPLLYGG